MARQGRSVVQAVLECTGEKIGTGTEPSPTGKRLTSPRLGASPIFSPTAAKTDRPCWAKCRPSLDRRETLVVARSASARAARFKSCRPDYFRRAVKMDQENGESGEGTLRVIVLLRSALYFRPLRQRQRSSIRRQSTLPTRPRTNWPTPAGFVDLRGYGRHGLPWCARLAVAEEIATIRAVDDEAAHRRGGAAKICVREPAPIYWGPSG